MLDEENADLLVREQLEACREVPPDLDKQCGLLRAVRNVYELDNRSLAEERAVGGGRSSSIHLVVHQEGEELDMFVPENPVEEQRDSQRLPHAQPPPAQEPLRGQRRAEADQARLIEQRLLLVCASGGRTLLDITSRLVLGGGAAGGQGGLQHAERHGQHRDARTDGEQPGPGASGCFGGGLHDELHGRGHGRRAQSPNGLHGVASPDLYLAHRHIGGEAVDEASRASLTGEVPVGALRVAAADAIAEPGAGDIPEVRRVVLHGVSEEVDVSGGVGGGVGRLEALPSPLLQLPGRRHAARHSTAPEFLAQLRGKAAGLLNRHFAQLPQALCMPLHIAVGGRHGRATQPLGEAQDGVALGEVDPVRADVCGHAPEAGRVGGLDPPA
mmetsp:Transcript_43423/g.124216  ORF Transcript_43423/g.124216 Transcript_43423/m.124216 type:complete len:385 (+) Transcript_43423:806-1960(+)